jgi:hypothetical protein
MFIARNFADKRDIILESQLPQGMSGEKLKALEQGPVPEVVEEEKPQVPPKFLYEVSVVIFPLSPSASMFTVYETLFQSV